jgi:predicted RecB family nuclease
MPTHHINASATKAWTLCARRLWFDHNPPAGLVPTEDAFETLIHDRGYQHEAAILAHYPEAIEAVSAAHTRELMAARTAVIYQPQLVSDTLGVQGRPDFLILAEDGHYQVADAKLATKVDKAIAAQLALYRHMANSIHPALAFLGNGDTHAVDDTADSTMEAFLHETRAILAQSTPPRVHFSLSKCQACPYDGVCRPGFHQSGELTLIYGVDARSVPGLIAQGITTIEQLAQADAKNMTDVPYLKGKAKKQRAILQARSYLSGELFRVAELAIPSGTQVHFDIEANPLSDELGTEVYLWGLLPPPYDSQSFDYTWSDGGMKNDRQTWLDFLALVEVYRSQYQDLVLVHYASYERTNIKLYAERYDMQAHPTVNWLLGDDSPLFDLQRAVRNALVLPLLGYGLKAICKDKRLVNFQWELEESGSQWSVVRYIDYLNVYDPAQRASIKDEILSYNRDDVRATHALEAWARTMTHHLPLLS